LKKPPVIDALVALLRQGLLHVKGLPQLDLRWCASYGHRRLTERDSHLLKQQRMPFCQQW
jgi:hypothetical protein